MYRDTISVIGFKCFNSLHLVHISDLHQEESLLVVRNGNRIIVEALIRGTYITSSATDSDQDIL